MSGLVEIGVAYAIDLEVPPCSVRGHKMWADTVIIDRRRAKRQIRRFLAKLRDHPTPEDIKKFLRRKMRWLERQVS